MSSRPLVILGVIIILLAFISAGGYLLHSVHNRGPLILPPGTVASSSNTSYGNPLSTSTTGVLAATQIFPLPTATSSPVDISSWTMHVNNDLGYSIEYPPSFAASQNDGVLTLIVPKESYFHWPLLDDVKITVSASASCPAMTVTGGVTGRPASDSYVLNSRTFTRLIGTDGAAGNRYLEIADATKANGTCYRVDFLNHGTNGAGFYVDDPALVAKYDAQHDTDLWAAITLMNAMVSSLHILAPAQ
ncbi:MAG: hypothetical protein JWO00_94 [Candidatus Parcubacteria bacterium]|nr:hypothetical protein [Candidatus Parcubacteria bacterium]